MRDPGQIHALDLGPEAIQVIQVLKEGRWIVINVHDPGSRNCAIIVLYTVSIVPSSTSRV